MIEKFGGFFGRLNGFSEHWDTDMRALLCISLFATISLAGFSQGSRQLDSLYRAIQKETTDERRLVLYNLLAFAYWNTKPDSTIFYAKRAERLARKIGDRHELVNSLGHQANGLTSLGKLDSAVDFYKRAIHLADSLGAVELIADLKTNLAGVYYRLGNLRESLRLASEGQILAEQYNDASSYIASTTLVGSLNSDFENFSEAVRVLSALIRYMERTGAGEQIGYPLLNLGNAYFALEKIDSSRYLYQRAVVLARSIGDFYLLEMATYRLVEVLAIQHQPARAQAALDSLKNQPDFRPFPELQPERILTLIELAVAWRDFDTARKFAWKGIREVGVTGQYYAGEFFSSLARIYETTRDFDSAYHYMKIAVNHRDSVNRVIRASELAFWNLDNELQSKERREIQLTTRLERERERSARMNLLLMVAGVGIFVGIVVLVAVMRLVRQKEQLNQVLQSRNGELQVSMAEVKRLDREIRKMMMQIVHDLRSPLNSAFAALQLIGKANPEVEKLMAMAAGEVRRGQAFISSLLKSVEIGEWKVEVSRIELEPFITQLAERYRSRCEEKHIKLSVGADRVYIISDRLALDRIIDNLLSNAVKFSPPETRVTVSARMDRELVLKVTDQGPGFSIEDRTKISTDFQRLSAIPKNGEESHGVGLSSVYALVKVLGGTVNLKTVPGQGSEFEIRIPVKSEPETNAVNKELTTAN